MSANATNGPMGEAMDMATKYDGVATGAALGVSDCGEKLRGVREHGGEFFDVLCQPDDRSRQKPREDHVVKGWLRSLAEAEQGVQQKNARGARSAGPAMRSVRSRGA